MMLNIALVLLLASVGAFFAGFGAASVCLGLAGVALVGVWVAVLALSPLFK